MGFSALALLIGLNTAQADVRIVIRPNRRPHTHQTCNHPAVGQQRHRNARPAPRAGGTWIWVPRQRVKHNHHWHTVPGHWEHRPPSHQRRRIHGSH